MSADLEDRIRAVERLVRVFRLERIVYLLVTGLALVMLLTAAVVMLVRSQADVTTLTLLFGSSGLITFSIGRVLRMWDQALRIVSGRATPGVSE